MKTPVNRLIAFVIFSGALFFCGAIRAQLPPSMFVSARSISGQFAVIAAQQVSPLARQPLVLTNSEIVRLDPALLAVSAERIKKSLWQELDIDDSQPWRGQIFLALHPAQSLDENVTVISSRFNNGWNYRVELPDILSRSRLTRAITSVVLLEFANRSADDRCAEIPAWLADGLSEQLLAENSTGFILSSPTTLENGIPEKRFVGAQRGWDSLIEAHRVLQNHSALTFEQLSWPADTQLSGNDGGIYRASAQLFVSELLGLKNGAADLRAMLQALPEFYNWQLAFHAAFKSDFPQPVDLEKWWALRTVNFASLDIGPMWTPAASRGKLDEILTVPVDYRTASNNFPEHVEISLQAVVRNFDSARRAEIFQTKLRDLQLAELQMSPQFAQLTEQYRRTISDYLGQSPPPQKIILSKHFSFASAKSNDRDILKKLDALDAQRRAAEPAQMPALTGRDSNL